MKNKPLFERVITVTGKEVQNPSNLLARIGTPMNQLIEECGGLPENTGKVIGGGPMMGKALMNLDVPVCKGSSGLLLMSERNPAVRNRSPASVAPNASVPVRWGSNPICWPQLPRCATGSWPKRTTSRHVSNAGRASLPVLPHARCWIISVWVRLL